MKKLDYLIVGQGIAGSLLAYQLLKLGKKILIIDKGDKKGASYVSAGICNPITGRHWAKTWLLDEIFPFLHQFYQNLQEELNTNFYKLINVYRPFHSIEQSNEWQVKTSSPDWDAYASTSTAENNQLYTELIDTSLGGWETKNACHIDVVKLIESLRLFFERQFVYQTEKIDFSEIKIDSSSIYWKEYQIDKIVFCEGAFVNENPYFNWLPFRPVKGEWLKIKIKDKNVIDLPNIINAGFFILPLPNENLFQVGATYDWQDLTLESTKKGREQLEKKLKKTLKLEYEIIEQKAGIRPASLDRRPILGSHPNHKNLLIMNGFGTKGVSLSPYFSKHLVKYLEQGLALHPEVSIERFLRFFPN